MTDVTPRDGFFRKLWKYKWLIVATTMLGAASAYVASRYLPERYRAQAVVVVEPQSVPEEFVKSTVNQGIANRLQTIQQKILSRSRLERTIEQFDLYPEERRKGIMEDVVQHMRDDIHIQVKSGEAFTVSYDGASPHVVQKVCESIMSSFIDESYQDRELLAQGTDRFLESTLEDVRRHLVEDEKHLAEAAAKNGGRQPSQIPVLEYEALQQTYRSLLIKKEESRIAASLERRQIGEQFKLIDPARIPEQPISPDRARLNTIGALVGFAVGVVFVASRRRS